MTVTDYDHTTLCFNKEIYRERRRRGEVYARLGDNSTGKMFDVDDLPVWAAIELRLTSLTQEFVFTLWVNDRGIIKHSLDNGRGGSSHSVSNLQLKEIMPTKAFPGWQAVAIAAAGSGLYVVEEVR